MVLWMEREQVNIYTITTTFLYNTTINCYLVQIPSGFILIDTGIRGKRRIIEKDLENLGCKKGALRLIVLTHGDPDHVGNAAYFSKRYDAPIGIHKEDAGMVEYGDMLFSRRKRNIIIRIMFKMFFRLKKSDRFKPDIYLTEDSDLGKYGFDAKIVEIPGHSRGSIGVLTKDGDLFCGDLFANIKRPDIGGIIDDPSTAEKSIKKLKNLSVQMIYPGHGQPFPGKEVLSDGQ